LAVLLTLVLGAMHGASPGHGKTLVVATLLGSRGNIGQVLMLAAMVAITHTAGVLLLAIVVLTANDALLPQVVTPFITLAASLLVVVFGMDLTRRARRLRSQPHDHDHGHDHPHAAPGLELTRGYTLSVGLVGGLVPNGTALVVLMTAIAFRELFVGMLLVATFGLGIAAALVAVGVAAIVVRRRGGKLGEGHGRVSRVLALAPLASGLTVVAVGLFLTVQAASRL
jgi:nickel/cobalt exporter